VKEWFAANEVAGLAGMPGTVQAVNMRARREGWQGRKREGRGGGNEYHIDSLPEATRYALTPEPAATPAPKPAQDKNELWEWYRRLPDSAKDTAKQRLYAIQRLDELLHLGMPEKTAVAQVARIVNKSAGAVRRWRRSVRTADRSDWLVMLAPRYVGRQAEAACSEPAWRLFLSLYLSTERPSLAIAHEHVARAAADNGWDWPCEQTIRRRLKRRVPNHVITLEREGREALRDMLPAQERDRTIFHALEAVNTDGHVWDWWVRFPDGDVNRPVTVGWQDLYSNLLLSWRVDKTENADGVRLSFGDLVEQYGIPNDAYMDNGHAFAAKWITGGTANRYRFQIKDEEPVGILTQLGVRVHWVLPHRGQSKPIERCWRELEDRLRARPELRGCWAGNAPGVKPDEYQPDAVDLDTFLSVVDAEVRAYNARTGRRTQAAQGRSFADTFRASYEQAVIPQVTDGQRDLWLLAAEGVTCSKRDSSIRLHAGGNRYWDAALSEYAGTKLVVRFDPQRLHDAVRVYTPDGRFICEAACWERVGFNDSEAGRERARLESQNRKAAQKQAENLRKMSALDAQKYMPALDPTELDPQPAATRMVHPPSRGNVAVQAEPEGEADQSRFEGDFQDAMSEFEQALKRRREEQL